jgi:hypothetical protein
MCQEWIFDCGSMSECSNTTTEIIEEHRDVLITVANADCSASWIAQELLSSVEGETSYSTKQSNRTDTDVTTQPENSTQKDSIFAY